MGTFKLRQRWFYRATPEQLARLMEIIELHNRGSGLAWLLLWIDGEEVSLFGDRPTPETVLEYYGDDYNW